MSAFAVLLVCCCLVTPVSSGGHVPDHDKNENDEQLLRVKRGSFLETFLETFPFLHIGGGSVPSEEPEEDHFFADDLRAHFFDENLDQSSPSEFLSESNVFPSPSALLMSTSGMSLAATSQPGRHRQSTYSYVIAPNSVIVSHARSEAVKAPTASSVFVLKNISRLLHSPVFTMVSPTSSASRMTEIGGGIHATELVLPTPTPSPAHSFSVMRSASSPASFSSIRTQHLISTSMLESKISWSLRPSLMPVPTPGGVLTSSVTVHASVAADIHQIIDVVVLSAENPLGPAFMQRADLDGADQGKLRLPKLPDEQGYGGSAAQEVPATSQAETRTKNLRLLYGNVAIPLLSGLIGAALIICTIMMHRYCRRRKLRKVRYFGGKPNADFVRLDQHMSLLSETDSDED